MPTHAAPERLAVYTTVYPGVEPYLGQWYASLLRQTDGDFDLWIGADDLSIAEAIRACGARPRADWVIAQPGETPAWLRQRAISEIVERYDAVVFVDSDDVLHPRRVEMARRGLADSDLVACALRLIDEHGRDLRITFGPRGDEVAAALLPRYNVFGLSNTAYRCYLLKRCLPVPSDCVLVDWLLATRAWSLGATARFDPMPYMAYRQHGANIARVLCPFTASQILASTDRVRRHYAGLLESPWKLPSAAARALRDARACVERFHRVMHASAEALTRYADALNRLQPRYVWWWHVAHPDLEHLWKHSR